MEIVASSPISALKTLEVLLAHLQISVISVVLPLEQQNFVPRPNLMGNLLKYLHECAHFFLHRHDKKKPHHLREFEAETWALGKMRAGGLALPHEFVCESKRRIANDIAGDRNKGIRINKQAEEFARPCLHDPDHSDFINNVDAGILELGGKHKP